MALKINDNGIDRNMTADEEAAHLAWAKIVLAEKQDELDAIQTKAAARQAVLNKLGLTAEEVALLLD